MVDIDTTLLIDDNAFIVTLSGGSGRLNDCLHLAYWPPD